MKVPFRNIKKLRFIPYILFFLVNIQLQGQSLNNDIFDRKLSPEDLIEDFEIFKTGLEKLNPGLYRYSSKEYMDSIFNEARMNIKQELSYAEFYQVLVANVASIKCNHTIATPDSETLEQIRKTGLFFPLRVYWEFNPVKAYAAYDFSSEANLTPGTRIRSINGQSIEDIYSYLISLFSSDGYILTNKHSRLQYGMDFQMWYFLLIDRPESFVVDLEDSDGHVFKKTYSAVTLKQWTKNYKKYISQKDPELSKYIDYWVALERKNRSKPIRIEFLPGDIALITVMNFHSHKFESIITKAFTQIKEKKIQNLIIDVRNNGGGSDILGRYLFGHLIDKPTEYFDSLYTATGISDTTFLYTYTDKNDEWFKENQQLVYQLPDGRYSTKTEVNKGLLIQQPDNQSFKGDVYVLMNGRSASTTAEFTAATHINKIAIFIGEESGGAYHGGNGGDFASLILPNSKIVVEVPLSKYVMNSKEPMYIGRGTLPDYIVNTSMQDILELRDPQLEFALKLIKKKKND